MFAQRHGQQTSQLSGCRFGSPLPDLRFIYSLCIVEFLFIIQVFCLQKVIVNGTWLNGINEIQNRQTCANFRVLHREKG